MKIPILLVNILCVAAVNGAVLLWDMSQDASEYKVQIASQGQTNFVQTYTNSHTLTNLVSGRQYMLSVIAVEGSLESIPSEAITFTPAQGIPPGPSVISQSLLRTNNQWRISVAWGSSPAQYAVSGYYLTINQDGVRFTNLFTTNLSATVMTPAKSPTTVYLQATNYVGLSSSTPVATYNQPGQVRNVNLVLP